MDKSIDAKLIKKNSSPNIRENPNINRDDELNLIEKTENKQMSDNNLDTGKNEKNKKQEDTIWLERYNKFLEKTKFKNLRGENEDFPTFKINQIIVEEINKARTNCECYHKKIKDQKNLIKYDRIRDEKYLLINKTKFYVYGIENRFNESINYLKKIDIEMKTNNENLKKLTYANELKFPFPREEKKLKDKIYQNSTFERIKKKFEGIYKIEFLIAFHVFYDPEIFTMLEIIDINKKGNSRAILDKQIRFIGVNSRKLLDGYFVYILLSE